jgi:UDP-N-acetylmuramyl pentapeptide phosphotransferase/UDP-N-acetylglucosamine-1-phosphate transferase
VYAVVGFLYAVPVLMVAGAVAAVAALSFLPWKGGRARIFLGDVGAYGRGGLLAATAAYGLLLGAPAEPVLAPLALYLADTGWTLARRFVRGGAWYQAHRSHAYQRLTDLGWSHQQVTAVTAVASAAVCACALATAQSPASSRAALAVLVLAGLVTYLAAPSALGARPAPPERRVHARSIGPA